MLSLVPLSRDFCLSSVLPAREVEDPPLLGALARRNTEAQDVFLEKSSVINTEATPSEPRTSRQASQKARVDYLDVLPQSSVRPIDHPTASSCGRARKHQNSGRSSGSYGRGGGGGTLGFDSNGDVAGGGTGTPGKIPEMLRAAFFDPDYDTSRQHLVKLVRSDAAVPSPSLVHFYFCGYGTCLASPT